MKAVRLHDRFDLRVEEVGGPPPPSPGFVNVKVRAAGICGSDIHNFRTGQWILRGPTTAGHEFSGCITAVGDDVDNLAVGDLVVADSRYWCGDCPACWHGRYNICESLRFVGEACDGGLAEEVQLPARLVVRYDVPLDARTAAFAEPLAVALHVVGRLRVPAGEPVLVVGCGTIGCLVALVLSDRHDGRILVWDRNLPRVDLVARLSGASPVDLDPRAIAAVTTKQRLRYAVDATGSISAIQKVIAVLAGGGALALAGLGYGRLEIDPNLIVEREVALVGCHAFAGELADAISLLPELATKLTETTEMLSALEDVPQAYQRLLDGRGSALKTMVELTN